MHLHDLRRRASRRKPIPFVPKIRIKRNRMVGHFLVVSNTLHNGNCHSAEHAKAGEDHEAPYHKARIGRAAEAHEKTRSLRSGLS